MNKTFRIPGWALAVALAVGADQARAQSGVTTYDLQDLSQLNAAGSYRPISFRELNAANQRVNGLPLPDWQPGVVQFRDGTFSPTLRLRYDPSADVVRASPLPTGPQDYYRPPPDERAYYPSEVTGFLLAQAPLAGGQTTMAATDRAAVHFRALPLDANAFVSAFFDELTPAAPTGVQLLARYVTHLETGGTYVPALNVGSRMATERLETSYCLYRAGQLPRASRLTRKTVLAALADRAAAVEAYATAQKIGFVEPAHVAQLVQYYCSLAAEK
ncbi:MAG: hypothetical protein H7330_03545 [Hymenobacteraceae bacterium]|nr:hypothetical protein [Hymenobacteraceae bacterium]